jgi:hypothetical protein
MLEYHKVLKKDFLFRCKCIAKSLRVPLLGSRLTGYHVPGRANGEEPLRVGGIYFDLLAQPMNVYTHNGPCRVFGRIITVYSFD